MKRRRDWIVWGAVIAASFLAVPQAIAQEEDEQHMCPMCQAMGEGMHRGMDQGMGEPRYDDASEVSVTGTHGPSPSCRNGSFPWRWARTCAGGGWGSGPERDFGPSR